MHILVVDDDSEIRSLLQRILTTKGHSVEVLDSGFSVGLRLASTDQPKIDAIILDFMMPGLSGHSVLLQLAGSKIGSATPILLYSAVPEEDLPDGALEQHPRTRYLQKGARVSELLNVIEALPAA